MQHYATNLTLTAKTYAKNEVADIRQRRLTCRAAEAEGKVGFSRMIEHPGQGRGTATGTGIAAQRILEEVCELRETVTLLGRGIPPPQTSRRKLT